jgi:CRP/FNR family transcriptional regulator, cyclic AMP receptor protein
MRLGHDRQLSLLASLALFARCSRRELADVAGVTVEATMPAGAVLTREGHRGALAYVIVDGSVQVTRGGRTVGTFGPGAIVGELSLIDGGVRTATVTAVDEISVLQINAEDFQRLIERSPHLTANLLRTMAERLRVTDQQVDLLA